MESKTSDISPMVTLDFAEAFRNMHLKMKEIAEGMEVIRDTSKIDMTNKDIIEALSIDKERFQKLSHHKNYYVNSFSAFGNNKYENMPENVNAVIVKVLPPTVIGTIERFRFELVYGVLKDNSKPDGFEQISPKSIRTQSEALPYL